MPGPPSAPGPVPQYAAPVPPWWSPPDPRRWGLGDVGYGLLLAIGGQTIVGVLLVVLGVTGEGDLDLPPWGILLAVAAGWVGFVGWPVVASYVKGQRSLALDFGLRFRPVDVGWGVLGGIAVLGFSVALNIAWHLVTGKDAPENSGFLPESPSFLTAALLVLAVAVITPFAEELFFRGLLLRALEKRFNPKIAVVVSSVVFGALHLTGVTSATDLADLALQGVFVAVVITLYGLVFALLATYTGRLAPPIIAHMVVNGVGVVSYLLT